MRLYQWFRSFHINKPTLPFSPVVRKRYLLEDEEGSAHGLANRVARALAIDTSERHAMTQIMAEQRFWPAGNVLLAGIEPIRPNCCIFPPFKDEEVQNVIKRARPLWQARIGIGFDLGQCNDPVRILCLLSEANQAIPMDHRPQRGNMAVVPISHPHALQWIQCKRNTAQDCYNFNISLTVEDEETWYTHEYLHLPLAEHIHASGDPGLVFLDRIRANTPYDYEKASKKWGPISTVVPCGEQGMHPNESCTLGALNLAAPAHWHVDGTLNEHALRESLQVGFHILDVAQARQDYAGDTLLALRAVETRRIGLGIMGWADVIGDCYAQAGDDPLLHQIGSIYKEEASKVHGKHLTATCIQPTGGITLLTGNRGYGIEPAMDQAHALTPQEHIQVMNAWQPYVDNCISKTINLPHESTILDVLKAIQDARAFPHCKSITLYRDGSHQDQPIQCKLERNSQGKIRCE